MLKLLQKNLPTWLCKIKPENFFQEQESENKDGTSLLSHTLLLFANLWSLNEPANPAADLVVDDDLLVATKRAQKKIITTQVMQ